MSGAIWSFVFGLVLSIGLVPLCRIVAFRTGVVAHPRNDRWHRATVPLLGGVAIALSTLIVAIATGNAVDLAVPLSAAMFISVAGLADDVLNLKPATKLLAQIVVAAWLVYFGYRLNWIESRLIDSVLTMVWVVGSHQRVQPARQHGRPVRGHRTGRGADAGRGPDRRRRPDSAPGRS